MPSFELNDCFFGIKCFWDTIDTIYNRTGISKTWLTTWHKVNLFLKSHKPPFFHLYFYTFILHPIIHYSSNGWHVIMSAWLILTSSVIHNSWQPILKAITLVTLSVPIYLATECVLNVISYNSLMIWFWLCQKPKTQLQN